MGATQSKIDNDKALLLCRERKRFVRQALDGRCSLAAAHLLYIQSLKRTGSALRKFVEPEAPLESSLYTSTSVTPEPLALTEKFLSQFSYPSPSMSQANLIDTFSPTHSPSDSSHFIVNYMKSGGASSTIVERPLVTLPAKIKSSADGLTNQKSAMPAKSLSLDPYLPTHSASPWDYFGLVDGSHQFLFNEEKGLNQGSEYDDIRRLQEEEDIHHLDDTEEKGFFTPKGEEYSDWKSNFTAGREDYSDLEDKFDEPTSVPLVQSYQRRADTLDSYLASSSPRIPCISDMGNEVKQLSVEKNKPRDSMDEADMDSVSIEKNRGPGSKQKLENRPTAKNFLLSIKEIDYLFLNASEAGKDVPRMLEANKLHFHPLFSESKARKSGASILFSTCLSCGENPEESPQEPPPDGMKYLTWHRSISSRSSSSRNPLRSASRNEILDSSGTHLNGFCMNAGSHASTLDRLYAWERKLYDEVKASGIVRKEYDMKCKLLRYQDSKGQNPMKIDKTRSVVKDLHSRTRVVIHRIHSISKTIEDLRDNELLPQLEELIEGLKRMWEIMLDAHKVQFETISTARNNGHSKLSLQSDSNSQATALLEYELNSLSSSFSGWINAQKSYLQAINGWLLKCVSPFQSKSRSRRNVEFCPRRALAPPIFVMCHDWLKMLEQLPTKEVVIGIIGLLAAATRYLPRQEKAKQKSISSNFSLKAERDGETASHSMRHEHPIDWDSTFESLHSSLIVFFDKFNKFAFVSVKGYAELQESVEEAKQFYRAGGMRMQK